MKNFFKKNYNKYFKYFFLTSILRKRAQNAIDSINFDLKYFESTKSDNVSYNIAKRSIELAKELLVEDIDKSWNHIHLANQNILRLLNEEEQISRAELLKIEVKKISDWRQEQILKLLGNDEESIRSDFSIEKLVKAVEIRDDYYNTRNHKLSLRKASLNYLAVVIVIIILLIVIFSGLIKFPSDTMWQDFIVVILYGSLGASLSLAYTIVSNSAELKIPEQLAGMYLFVIRISIGGTAALVSYLFFKSGLLDQVINKKILDENGFGYLIIAFIAGFSDTWVKKLINNFTKE